MSFKYGFRVVNDFGSYLVDGEHPNMTLFLEQSMSSGFHTITVNKKGMPLLAIKDGCGKIMSISVVNGICQSVRLYIKPFTNTSKIRIYFEPWQKDIHGIAVYSSSSNLVFSSTNRLLNIREATAHSSNANMISFNENPPGYITHRAELSPKDGEKYNYSSTFRVDGSWLLLNALKQLWLQ